MTIRIQPILLPLKDVQISTQYYTSLVSSLKNLSFALTSPPPHIFVSSAFLTYLQILEFQEKNLNLNRDSNSDLQISGQCTKAQIIRFVSINTLIYRFYVYFLTDVVGLPTNYLLFICGSSVVDKPCCTKPFVLTSTWLIHKKFSLWSYYYLSDYLLCSTCVTYVSRIIKSY